MASTQTLLKRLIDRNVEFVVVGGLAGTLHGSSMVTQDLDVCAPLSLENAKRILAALEDLNPRWRMNPLHQPLSSNPADLTAYKNLYLLTDLGQVDFMTEITGVGSYQDVSRHSVAVDLGEMSCRVLDLDTLILAKRAMGRPKDLQAAAELEAIRERQKDRS